MPEKQRFRIILVEPEFELNVGAVARAMKNFGFLELALVSPKCDPRGFDAIKYSKHARDVLENAKTYKTLSQAKKGCKFTVGTTGVLYRHFHSTIRSPIALKDLHKKLAKNVEGRIAIVFGNEGIGLTEEQISECDFLVTIPTSPVYPILNLSHAVAIAIYELSKIDFKASFALAGENEKEALIRAFSLITDNYSRELRNARKVKIAFRRIIGKAMPTDKECAAVLGVLRRAQKELEKK
jgi:tRNA/rRNA methyltransferase